jgi:predicted Zn finger-like uncharacterized protein
LYTQCIKCETVFRLSAEVLRAAGGQVRCGRCGVVFNALARLAEDPSAFPAAESPLDMESRADEILESAVPPLKQPGQSSGSGHEIIEIEEFDANDIDFARLQVVDRFEEHLPPVVPRSAHLAPAGAPVPTRAPAPTGGSRPARAATAKPKTAPAPVPTAPPKPSIAIVEDDEGALEEGALEFTLPPGDLDRVFVERTTHSPPSSSAVESSSGPAEELHDLSEKVRRDIMSGMSEPAVPEFSEAPRRSIPFNVWLGAAIFLALLLCAQLLHGNREWVATHAPMRGALRGVYAAMGVVVSVPANLAAYQLRQWGVTGDPTASGTLRVRASILNTTAQLQPYPLLRVTLANRFGTKLGARDFEPAEYMGKPIVRMLAPGERADATLDIVDPGKDAEGFEIDVCVRGADQKISCAGDVAAQAKT